MGEINAKIRKYLDCSMLMSVLATLIIQEARNEIPRYERRNRNMIKHL